MKPITFNEQNFTYNKPKGWTDEECSPLPVFKNHEQIISCWEISDEEIERIKETKRIWLHVWAQGQPPVLVSSDYPFLIGNSVITICNDCKISGVNLPDNKECGNCGSLDTREEIK